MILSWWCPFKIQKEKQADPQFTSMDFLSLVLISLIIRWTIPLNTQEYEIRPNFFTTLKTRHIVSSMLSKIKHQNCGTNNLKPLEFVQITLKIILGLEKWTSRITLQLVLNKQSISYEEPLPHKFWMHFLHINLTTNSWAILSLSTLRVYMKNGFDSELFFG